MGYMTVAMILNDAGDQVKKHPQQVAENLYKGMSGVDMRHSKSAVYSIGNNANPMTVLSAQHADTPQLILAHRNDINRFGYHSELTSERVLEYRKSNLELAKSLLKEEEKLIKKMEAEFASSK